MLRGYAYLLVRRLPKQARCLLTTVFFLALVSFANTTVLAQEVRKCQVLEKSLASLEKTRKEFSALAELARKFDFYKDFAAKLQRAVAGGYVVPQLENYSELFLAAEAGQPGASAKERLEFQRRFLPVLESLLNELLNYPDEETFSPRVQEINEKVETVRQEYRGLKCEEVLKENASGKCTVPDIIGMYITAGDPTGLLRFDTQNGNHVTGKYGSEEDFMGNTIEGTFQCNVLTGTFTNTAYQTTGTFTYTFARDGSSYLGKWRNDEGGASGTTSGRRRPAKPTP
jgi:hypothetical protein